jgi:GDPmannose 4,6-dehydratase
MSKRAICTGVLGQDASWLSEHLISLGYDVYGVYKRVSSGNNLENISQLTKHPRFHLIEGDICDAGFVNSLVKDLQPDEYYGLAAMSHVGHSFKIPVETFKIDAEAVIIQLEAIRHFSPSTKFYNAATSELFGGLGCPEQGFDESSKFNPRSPYAVAKLAAFHATKNYREAYRLHASSGILFNHSSTRRGEDFATRKITMGIANIVAGKATNLCMGNLEAFRDEGHAKDYVRAMHLILQQDNADDFVVATGTGATIREMLEHVCGLANLKIEDVYIQDERFMRPSEVPRLLGNPTKIRQVTGWKLEYTWKSLLTEMYEHDLAETTQKVK